MHIAIIGSVLTAIPPDGQSSVERLAYYQALGFAKRGHTVTLYAPTGSAIQHELVSVVDVGLPMHALPTGTNGKPAEEVYGGAYTTRARMSNDAVLFAHLLSHQQEFDVVLNNSFDEAPLLASHPNLTVPMYHILHVPIIPQAAEIFAAHNTLLIPISNAQRKSFPHLRYTPQTVYNCVDTTEFAFSAGPGAYLLYLGSIGRNKNPKDAIRAAQKSGIPLKIGGKLKDRAYYEAEIAPHIDAKLIQWVGELHPAEVVRLYQGALAFLFPTLWEEPFGLVAIEAMACGTPVIAYPNGGLVEIVESGKNGFLVKDLEEMVEKIKIINNLERKNARDSVEERFSVDQMVEGYLSVFNTQ